MTAAAASAQDWQCKGDGLQLMPLQEQRPLQRGLEVEEALLLLLRWLLCRENWCVLIWANYKYERIMSMKRVRAFFTGLQGFLSEYYNKGHCA
jgi:hypothetical protein